MRLRHLLFASVIFLLSGFVNAASACECLQAQPPCATYWKSDAVFAGKVTEVSTVPVADKNAVPLRSVRFSIERAYRGVEGEQVELLNVMSSCEYPFEKGKSYFVYAYRNQQNNSLGTSGCSGTREFSSAKEDIGYAEGISGGKPEQSISGSVVDMSTYAPVKGVKVNIKGESRDYSAVTDDQGRFKVLLTRPGKYTVRFILPRNSTVAGVASQVGQFNNSYWEGEQIVVVAEVNLEAGRCTFFDVPLVIVEESPNSTEQRQQKPLEE